MECKYCGAQWVLKDGKTKFANCPFCGKELEMERTDKKYTDFYEALRAIVQMKGIDYLIDEPSKVLAIFLDIAQNLQKEYRLLKLFYSNDTQKVFKGNLGIADGKLNMAVRSLQENAFMDVVAAKYVVNVFAEVLGIKQEADISAIDSEKWKEEPEQGETQEKTKPKELEREKAEPEQLVEMHISSTNEITVAGDDKRNFATDHTGIISAEDFRKGITIELEDNVYQIIEYQHVRPGKGAAFVRAKLKDVKKGGVIEKTFRPTEKFSPARIDRKDMQYLFSDGGLFYFMDTESYEQITLKKETVGDSLKFVKENEICKVCFHNGNVFSVVPPFFVELEIINTEPGFKGNTATGASKPATVETGAQINVPLFVERGDRIKIDTITGEYLCRV